MDNFLLDRNFILLNAQCNTTSIEILAHLKILPSSDREMIVNFNFGNHYLIQNLKFLFLWCYFHLPQEKEWALSAKPCLLSPMRDIMNRDSLSHLTLPFFNKNFTPLHVKVHYHVLLREKSWNRLSELLVADGSTSLLIPALKFQFRCLFLLGH